MTSLSAGIRSTEPLPAADIRRYLHERRNRPSPSAASTAAEKWRSTTTKIGDRGEKTRRSDSYGDNGDLSMGERWFMAPKGHRSGAVTVPVPFIPKRRDRAVIKRQGARAPKPGGLVFFGLFRR